MRTPPLNFKSHGELMLAGCVAAIATVYARNFFLVALGVFAQNFYVSFDGESFHGIEFAEPFFNAFLRR